ncbi:MAG TPA: hypothetical protein PLL88_05675 [Anaerolineaceae bacterium]|nr:hypothetical protein [Anaerolineaceae bacterium]
MNASANEQVINSKCAWDDAAHSASRRRQGGRKVTDKGSLRS